MLRSGTCYNECHAVIGVPVATDQPVSVADPAAGWGKARYMKFIRPHGVL